MVVAVQNVSVAGLPYADILQRIKDASATGATGEGGHTVGLTFFHLAGYTIPLPEGTVSHTSCVPS